MPLQEHEIVRLRLGRQLGNVGMGMYGLRKNDRIYPLDPSGHIKIYVEKEEWRSLGKMIHKYTRCSNLLNYCRVSCFSPSKLPILWYPLVRGVGTHLIWCLKLPGVFGWDRVSKCFQREAEDFVSCFLVKVGDWDLFFPMRQMALTSWCFGGLGKGQVGMAAPFKRRGKTIVWTKFLKEERSQAKIGVCV